MIEVCLFVGLKFSVRRWFGNKPFSAEALFKYSKYSFFFGFNCSFQGSSPSLGIWSTLPCSTSKAKTWAVSHSLVGVCRRNIKKAKLFLQRWEYFFSKRNVKNCIKLAHNSYENSLTVWTNRRLSTSRVGGVQGDPPVRMVSSPF